MSHDAIVFIVPGQAVARRSAGGGVDAEPAGGLAGLDAEVRTAVRVGARRAGGATLVQCSTLISTYGAAPSPPWRRCKSSRCHPASLWFAPCHEGESAGP